VRGRPLHVCFVTANTFEYDSRTLRAARALTADGHRVTVVALADARLPASQTLDDAIAVHRPALDRRIASALRPLPAGVRGRVAGLLGLAADATTLPPSRGGAIEGLRGPLRRGLEILAYRRRIGPWSDAAVAAANDADVFSAKALVALPVVHRAARTTGTRFVYDIADLHVDSGRLAGMPGPVRSYLRRRERGWMHDAAGLTAVTAPLAEEVARRFDVPLPAVVMNCRQRWRPEDPRPPSSRRLRAAAGATRERPLVLYQGAFREDQGIEELLTAIELPALRDLELTVVFLGFGRLEARLRAAAAARPERVVVLPPVPTDELLEWTAGADVAFIGAPPKTLNLRLTIPNKLFESIMAGVPPLVSGGTAVARLVAEIGGGWVVEPWTAENVARTLAEIVRSPRAKRTAMRGTVRTAALKLYNWETEQAALVGLYRSLATDR
jgi:glycosyltransferase involved in cell wall biosynthesis